MNAHFSAKLAKLPVLSLAAIILILAQSAALAQQTSTPVRYRLIDLGTLGGPNSSETLVSPFVNNSGSVVGFSDTSLVDPLNPGAIVPHAFRWQRGVLTDLGTLPVPGVTGSFAISSNDLNQVVGVSGNGFIDPQLGTPEGIAVLWQSNGQIVNLGTLGGNQSLAGGINAQGQVIGIAANTVPDALSLFGWATQTRAVLWNKGAIQDLGTLGGTDAGTSYINEVGQITGISYIDENPSCPFDFPVTTHSFFWQNSKMVDLGTLGGSCSGSVKINNHGQIAGSSTLPGDAPDHPFLWQNGVMTDLGTLGGSFAFANWLNEGGAVAGGSTTSGDEALHAFFWRNGKMTDIGTIGGDICSTSHFMNERNQVVGTSGDCFGPQFDEIHGFLWQPGGPIIDLNQFVPPGSDLQITDGETINDAGEIAASGLLPNGDFHAILLVPCSDSSPACRTFTPGAASALPPFRANRAGSAPVLSRAERLAIWRSRFSARSALLRQSTRNFLHRSLP